MLPDAALFVLFSLAVLAFFGLLVAGIYFSVITLPYFPTSLAPYPYMFTSLIHGFTASELDAI